ncbi:MAG: glycosyltransferase [Candidatus Omnitrophica bacterium]|nr:glycosyltransferase [Candidatus Omnitrophota bacterium]
MPKVSVIIPTYNRGQYIQQALESVLAQTFHDYEIIVIDDGSTDNTQEILRRFKGKIRSMRQDNQGISKTRNQAISRSNGQYIAFLDSDDYWVSEKLEEQVRILDRHPHVGLVYARMPIINEQGERIGMKPSGVCGRNFKELLEVWGDLPTSTIMTRKECFERAGLFDTSLCTMEDIDMWIRIARYYDLYEIENKVLAYYRRHEEQITNNRARVYEGLVKIYTKICNTCLQAPRDLMKRRIVENQYLLAKENYIAKEYKYAFLNSWAAIKRHPLLGLLFINKSDHYLNRILKLIKPYGLMVMSIISLLLSGGRRWT